MTDRRIIVLCPDLAQASGGARKLYRLVDVLRKYGLPAVIGHQQVGFRYTWFDNATPIVYPPEMWPGDSDLLVVPEINAWELAPQTVGIPKVIFNQGAYQTFLFQASPDDVAPYRRPDYIATIVVSDDSRAYLEYAFPGHPIFRIHHSIDSRLFHFHPHKRRQIALMPRRNAADIAQVLGMLQNRASLRGFEIVKIEGKTEAETAAILRESMIFLSFQVQEGWGLPPMEAMACGCITIGYDGRGGREYLNSQYAFPVERDDIVGFARTVEQVIAQLDENPGPLIEKARLASEFILSSYLPEREERDILLAWRQILPLVPKPGPA